MDFYAHKDDCSITRGGEQFPGKAVLWDCDGEVLFVCAESWTDEQIYHALAFANKTYSKGCEIGQHQKMWDIKKALGING
ncbi:MAG: hypothetical protein OQK32_00485 [Gammaproteobacteria bacterium]|nr:hypothetical protein [Gammaproteobacteria bacterium]MCW8924093.1 hypothetical protein [Gammaproteobacteria bacterium]